MRRLLLAALILTSCSGTRFDGQDQLADPDAEILPLDVGVVIAESSAALDSAAIETILPGTHRRVTTTGFALDPDMLLRRLVDAQGREHLYTIHRTQGVIVERDRSGNQVARFDVTEPGIPAAKSDPADVALGPDGALWVTRFGLPTLLVLEPDGARRRTVDLASFDDDGLPQMTAIAIDGGRVLVALEKLDTRLQTKTKGTIVAIDLTTYAATAFVDLPAKTPREKFVRGPDGALYVACIGGPLSSPVDRDAALVRVDPSTKTATKVLDGTAAGGFVSAFDLADGVTGYAIVADYDGDNPTRLVTFDVQTGTVGATWATSAHYKFWDVAAVGDQVLLADRTDEAPGLRVLSRRDGSRLGHVSTRLPPIEFVVVRSPG
ncbi:MAG: hypothetical protein ACXVEF_17075 [Polyangiales bacterium]